MAIARLTGTLRSILRTLFGTRARALRTGLVALVLYVAAVGTLYAAQRHLIFRNGTARLDPAARYLPDMREQQITAPDGTRLVLWTAPPQPSAPVIVYFHGNAGVMGHRSGRFKWMRERGWGIVALAYRGSGGSTGSPSEIGHGIDARAVYDALPSLLGQPVDATDIILYGESLGTGVAVTLATQRPVGGVILETPYAALDDLVQGLFPIIPIKPLGMMHDPFRSIDRIDSIGAPLLIMHGTWDMVIPIQQAQRLFDAAQDPKWYRWFGGGRHYDLWHRGAKDSIAEFIDRYYPSKRRFSVLPSATRPAAAPPQ